jgi:hypothetical protein
MRAPATLPLTCRNRVDIRNSAGGHTCI